MKTFKVKLYPTESQSRRMEQWLITLQRHYNRVLAITLWTQRRYNLPVSKSICGGLKTPKKDGDKRPYIYGIYVAAKRRNQFLNDIPADTVNQTIQSRIEAAFDKWAAACKGKKGEDFFKGQPKFANRDRFTSFQFRTRPPRPLFTYDHKGRRYLNIPNAQGADKIGPILCSLSPDTPSDFTKSFCAIQREPDGWYACIVINLENQVRWDKAPHGVVGIDVNIGSIDLSDGTRIPMPFFADRYRDEVLRLTQKLARTRRENKDWRSSKRYADAKKRKAVLEARITRERKAWHANVVAWLVSRYDRIYVENLEPKNMVKNKHLAKAISSQAWGHFFEMLEMKCAEHGRIFGRVPPSYTSKTCSSCGWVNKAKPGEKGYMGLHVRQWVCPECQTHHNRDVNAAKNICAKGEEAFATGNYEKQELGKRKAKSNSKVLLTERTEAKAGTIIIPCPTLDLPTPPNLPAHKRRSKAEWSAKQRAERARRRNKNAKKEKLTSVDLNGQKKNFNGRKEKLANSTQLSLFC